MNPQTEISTGLTGQRNVRQNDRAPFRVKVLGLRLRPNPSPHAQSQAITGIESIQAVFKVGQGRRKLWLLLEATLGTNSAALAERPCAEQRGLSGK